MQRTKAQKKGAQKQSVFDCSHSKYAFKTCRTIAIKINNSLLEKTLLTLFVQQFVRNLCPKFKMDFFSRFCTVARQVFTIH